MRSELTAGSRHKRIVLYDPAAIPLDTPVDADLEAQDPAPPPENAQASLAERGQALLLEIAHEDCEATVRILLDETPETELCERAVSALDGAALRVPSGKLTVDGVEFLCRAGETRLHSEGKSIEIPAGDYEVQVYNLMPWKSRHRARVIAERTTKADRIVAKIVGAYTWLGVLSILATLLAASAALTVCLISGWWPALVVIGVALLVDLLVLGGFWVLDIASRWAPILKRASELDLAFDAENPDVVVLLRHRIGEGAATVRAMATLQVA